DEGSLLGSEAADWVERDLKPDELQAARLAYGSLGDAASLPRLLFRDLYFAAPARWLAGHAPGPAFLYRFSYLRRSPQGSRGATHGAEIPYVFDSWQRSPSGGARLAAEDRAEAALVHACWVSFAATGAPACPGAPAWPAYTRDDDRLMELGSAAELRPAAG